MAIKRYLFVWAFALLLSVPALGYCLDTPSTTQPQTVTIQLLQYNQLKTIIAQQETTLATLQDRLTLLSQASTEDKQTLIALQNQLNNCKQELTSAQQSLTTANTSLQTANATLQRQEKSLQTLTQQIKLMEHHQAVIKRQRDMWAIGVGVLAGALICKGR